MKVETLYYLLRAQSTPSGQISDRSVANFRGKMENKKIKCQYMRQYFLVFHENLEWYAVKNIYLISFSVTSLLISLHDSDLDLSLNILLVLCFVKYRNNRQPAGRLLHTSLRQQIQWWNHWSQQWVTDTRARQALYYFFWRIGYLLHSILG